MKTTDIYNKFYSLLYDGVIDEDSITLDEVKKCLTEHQDEFVQLCNELQDIIFSDRERQAFYLTMKFIEA